MLVMMTLGIKKMRGRGKMQRILDQEASWAVFGASLSSNEEDHDEMMGGVARWRDDIS